MAGHLWKQSRSVVTAELSGRAEVRKVVWVEATNRRRAAGRPRAIGGGGLDDTYCVAGPKFNVAFLESQNLIPEEARFGVVSRQRSGVFAKASNSHIMCEASFSRF